MKFKVPPEFVGEVSAAMARYDVASIWLDTSTVDLAEDDAFLIKMAVPAEALRAAL